MSQGANPAGGGTWWDDTRDEPIFGEEMPVFEIEPISIKKMGMTS